MAMVSSIKPMIIIIVSLIAGLWAFYLISDLSKAQKKKDIEELLSQLMNLFIFTWIGKILLNFTVFVGDPLAILAYPSNSSAFYLAVTLSAGTIAIKSKREQFNVLSFVKSFLYVFLIGSLVFEFIQIVWNHNTFSIRYFGLLAVLTILFLIIRERVATDILILIMVIGWTSGTLVLAFIMPFTVVFGYTMQPWFLGVFLMSCITVIILQRKKVL